MKKYIILIILSGFVILEIFYSSNSNIFASSSGPSGPAGPDSYSSGSSFIPEGLITGPTGATGPVVTFFATGHNYYSDDIDEGFYYIYENPPSSDGYYLDSIKPAYREYLYPYEPFKVGKVGIQNITALAYDPNKFILYGITGGSYKDIEIPTGSLVRIDPLTGQGVVIGWTGSHRISGMVFIPEEEKLYAVDSYLYQCYSSYGFPVWNETIYPPQNPQRTTFMKIDPFTGEKTIIKNNMEAGDLGNICISSLAYYKADTSYCYLLDWDKCSYTVGCIAIEGCGGCMDIEDSETCQSIAGCKWDSANGACVDGELLIGLSCDDNNTLYKIDKQSGNVSSCGSVADIYENELFLDHITFSEGILYGIASKKYGYESCNFLYKFPPPCINSGIMGEYINYYYQSYSESFCNIEGFVGGGTITEGRHQYPVAVITNPKTNVPILLKSGKATVSFDASKSVDFNGSPLIYKWDFNGDGNIDVTSESPTASYTYSCSTPPCTYTVNLTVSNTFEKSSNTSIKVKLVSSLQNVLLGSQGWYNLEEFEFFADTYPNPGFIVAIDPNNATSTYIGATKSTGINGITYRFDQDKLIGITNYVKKLQNLTLSSIKNKNIQLASITSQAEISSNGYYDIPYEIPSLIRIDPNTGKSIFISSTGNHSFGDIIFYNDDPDILYAGDSRKGTITKINSDTGHFIKPSEPFHTSALGFAYDDSGNMYVSALNGGLYRYKSTYNSTKGYYIIEDDPYRKECAIIPSYHWNESGEVLHFFDIEYGGIDVNDNSEVMYGVDICGELWKIKYGTCFWDLKSGNISKAGRGVEGDKCTDKCLHSIEDIGNTGLDIHGLTMAKIPVKQSPIAQITSPKNSVSFLVGDIITFDASKSKDFDGSIVSYAWNFGDGQSSNGKIVTHSYNSPGSYTVSLTVTDNDNLKDTYQIKIELILCKSNSNVFYTTQDFGEEGLLIRIDATTGNATEIGKIVLKDEGLNITGISGITFGPDGYLYGSIGGGNLLKVLQEGDPSYLSFYPTMGTILKIDPKTAEAEIFFEPNPLSYYPNIGKVSYPLEDIAFSSGGNIYGIGTPTTVLYNFMEETNNYFGYYQNYYSPQTYMNYLPIMPYYRQYYNCSHIWPNYYYRYYSYYLPYFYSNTLVIIDTETTKEMYPIGYSKSISSDSFYNALYNAEQPIPEILVGLTFDNEGTLYAIDAQSNIYTLDTQTGATLCSVYRSEELLITNEDGESIFFTDIEFGADGNLYAVDNEGNLFKMSLGLCENSNYLNCKCVFSVENKGNFGYTLSSLAFPKFGDPPSAKIKALPCIAQAYKNIEFEAIEPYDPSGNTDNLNYEWIFEKDGQLIDTITTNNKVIYNNLEPGNYIITLKTCNQSGCCSTYSYPLQVQDMKEFPLGYYIAEAKSTSDGYSEVGIKWIDKNNAIHEIALDKPILGKATSIAFNNARTHLFVSVINPKIRDGGVIPTSNNKNISLYMISPECLISGAETCNVIDWLSMPYMNIPQKFSESITGIIGSTENEIYFGINGTNIQGRIAEKIGAIAKINPYKSCSFDSDSIWVTTPSSYPVSITSSIDGSLYVALVSDDGNGLIRKYDSNIGSYSDLFSLENINPFDLAVNRRRDTILVSTTETIKIKNLQSGSLTDIANPPTGFAPFGITLDKLGTILYIADYENKKIKQYDIINGKFLSDLATLDNNPLDIALNINLRPIAIIGLQPSSNDQAIPQSISNGLIASFDGSDSYDPDGDSIISYTWDFGDGTERITTTSPTVTHTYQVPGSYMVTLVVSDGELQSDPDVYPYTISKTTCGIIETQTNLFTKFLGLIPFIMVLYYFCFLAFPNLHSHKRK